MCLPYNIIPTQTKALCTSTFKKLEIRFAIIITQSVMSKGFNNIYQWVTKLY